MSRQALYRKYRSRALDEVVGQSHVTDILAAQIAKQQFSHAYLLTGPRGIGKTSVARIIAYAANNLPYNAETLDIIEIDAASNNGVDDVRDLREKVNIAPVSAPYKIYIIDEVHMLSSAAFNALLKTLEEPPAHVIFILATTEVQKLPATILSRVQRFHFRPVAPESVAKHLQSLAKQEKIKIDDDALLLIAKRGGGSFRDSIGLLDQLSGFNENITRASVEEILGLPPDEIISQIVDGIQTHNSPLVVATLNQMKNEGISPSIIVEQLVVKLNELAPEKPKLYDLIERLIEVPKSANPEIKLIAILASVSAKNVNVAQSTAAPMMIEAPLATIKKAQRDDKEAERLAERISQNIAKETAKSVYYSEPDPESMRLESASTQTIFPEKQATSEVILKTASREKKAQSTASENVDAKKMPSQIVWHEIVDEVRKLNPPLAGVVSKANIDYEKSILTMYFQYKIHRTKMDDPKYKSILVTAFRNLYNAAPEIVIAKTAKTAENSENATVANVAAIMGGGEMV